MCVYHYYRVNETSQKLSDSASSESLTNAWDSVNTINTHEPTRQLVSLQSQSTGLLYTPVIRESTGARLPAYDPAFRPNFRRFLKERLKPLQPSN